MKRYLLLAGALVVLGSAGCSKAAWNREMDYSPRTVIVFNADGSIRHTYHATGKVYSESASDGWFFTDADDNKLTMVTGFVEIKQTK